MLRCSEWPLYGPSPLPYAGVGAFSSGSLLVPPPPWLILGPEKHEGCFSFDFQGHQQSSPNNSFKCDAVALT